MQIDYFSQMQLLVVFVLLGIGADDVFIFTDAFKQSVGVPSVGKSLQVNTIIHFFWLI